MNIKLNFTGKNKLNNEEFIEFYDRLWKEVPHKCLKNIPTQSEIQKRKTKFSSFYNNSEPYSIDNEVWDYYPCNRRYLVSSEGRIKYNFEADVYQLVKQGDYYKSRPGYLVLTQVNLSQRVYNFVAITFLGKIEGDGYDVHHINNNGYDCSTKNLILLTRIQHEVIHLDKHLSKEDLINYLNEREQEETIKKHLVMYKLNYLKIESSGFWKNSMCPHILPKNEAIKNLIMCSYEKEFRNLFESEKELLHPLFAHLNSSQALCFNLFYPLVISNRLSLIDSSVSKEAKAFFEYVEDNSFEKTPNRKEKTNFDFFINDKGNKYFFEIKYTERHFEPVKADYKHDKKYKAYYRDQVKKIANEEISEEEFFDLYQIWRNVCHSDTGKVYFVLPKNRVSLIESVNSVIKKCKKEYQNFINILFIEDLIQTFLKNDDRKLQKHFQEFFDKYLRY